MKQKRIAIFSLTAGLLGGGLAGMALGVPGLAGAQEAETTTTTEAPAAEAETTTTTPAPEAATTPAAPTPATPAAKPDKGQWVDDALKPLVDNGTLTQAQADAVASALDAARPPRGDHGGKGFHGAKLDAAAKALGLTVEELRAALEGGKSLADVAKDKGVDVSKVVDALVAEAKAKLAEGVSSGRITQEQADKMTADLQARITAFVNGERPAGGPGGFGGRGGHHGPGGRGPGGQPSSSATPSNTVPSSSTDGSQPA